MLDVFHLNLRDDTYNSVTCLGYFCKILASIFLTQITQMFGIFLGFFESSVHTGAFMKVQELVSLGIKYILLAWNVTTYCVKWTSVNLKVNGPTPASFLFVFFRIKQKFAVKTVRVSRRAR